MKSSLRRTATATVLAITMALGIGGTAEAAPASVPTTQITTASAAQAATWRWYGVGQYDVRTCQVLGAYYVGTGQARTFQCIPTGIFTRYLVVLIWY
ncbi:hypothetical protein [Streptomyces sp. NPDC002671]